jgi:hypothetical protein
MEEFASRLKGISAALTSEDKTKDAQPAASERSIFFI